MTAVAAIVYGWAVLVVDDHAPGWMIFAGQNKKLWLAGLRVCGGSALWTGCLFVRLSAINVLYIVGKQEPAWWLKRLLKLCFPTWLVIGLKMTPILDDMALWTLCLLLGVGMWMLWIWVLASIDRRPIIRPWRVHSLSLCAWVPPLLQRCRCCGGRDERTDFTAVRSCSLAPPPPLFLKN
eukprot:COSAG01_NODE_16847_length_1199_cov_2.586364_2_plen_179_part_01